MSEIIKVEWRPLVPGEKIHVGSDAVMPAKTRLYYATCTAANNLWSTADANGITLEMLIDAGARHLVICAISADTYIGFGEPPVSAQSVVIAAKEKYPLENVSLLAKHLYLLSSGPVVVQAFR